jgi:predicted phosphodiesterase
MQKVATQPRHKTLKPSKFKQIGHEYPKDTESKALYKRILQEIRRKPVSIHSYFPRNHAKIGLCSDTQCGSLYERLDLISALYRIFRKDGISHVYHAGDLIDGEKVYRGHEYEIAYHGVDAQVNHVVKDYPRVPGIHTHFITGNHDLAFWKNAGVDVGRLIAENRKDFDYLGKEEADILIQGVKLRLSHPGKGTSYAISYHPQKMVESLSGGEKPNILAIGHYHKAECLPVLRNVITIQTGCLQSQTPFMRRNHIAAHLGGWVIDLWINKKAIVKIKTEFIPFYERRVQ